MVSVPFCAPMVPPETGASMYFTPCSAAIFALCAKRVRVEAEAGAEA